MQLDTFNRNQIFKSRMGCSENKREQLIMFFHLHHSRKCYLVNMVYQYHHMTDGTRQSAEPVGNLSAADSLLPKRLQYLLVSKTVRLLRPTTTIVIRFRRRTVCRVIVKFDKSSTDTVELITFATPS